MPDREYQIKIKTTGDTAGGKAVEDQLDRIQQKAATTGKEAAAAAAPAAAAGEAAGGGLIGSLIGSFGGIAILGLVENVASRISAWAENLKRAAEEQRGLNREIDQAVRSYEKIRSPEQWDRENNKIEEQIQKLRDKRAIETDPAIRTQIDYEIAGYERQQTDLAILARLGLERAQAEEKVKLAIRDQINALAEVDRSSQRAVAASENRAKIENQLTDLQAKGLSKAVDLARERGLITETQAIAAKAKIERDADNENFNRSQRIADQKIRAINDEIARTKTQREEAQKNFDIAQSTEARGLKARQDAARLAQETRDAEQKARDERAFLEHPFSRPTERTLEDQQAIADQAQREADEKRRLLSITESYVRQLDHGKDSLEAELKLTKAILESRQQAEAAAKKRAGDIPEIEAQKKGEADLHAERQKNQDNNLSTLQEQHDKLVDITKSRGITEAERKAAHDAAQGLEPQIRDEQFKAQEQARNAELDRMTKRTQEGPAPGLTPQQTIDYFQKGPGAAPGVASSSDATLKEILGVLRQQVQLWQ